MPQVFFFYCTSNQGITVYYKDVETDKKTFLFSLQSNGRLNKMMKFEIKDTSKGYDLRNKSDEMLICFGYSSIIIKKQNSKSKSYCCQDNNRFDFHGIENALCGKTWPNYFTPKRITVIQMK